ncbi:MAG: M48 family metalloprotease [Zoogloeaceae bacterium]|nr:M48 family metalloprotease [Zoogloeaceae bacterium]
MKRKPLSYRSFLIGLAFVSALTGCATVINPVTGESERTVLDEPHEIAEGSKAHQQVLQEYGVYPDTKLQAYVNTLGQRLARQSHRSNLTWHFTVLDSPEINAFALPGGYVYVTRGIMAYLESEADLAGVIGHEIGHVTARHGAQRATRQQTAGIGVLAATILGAVLESQGVSGATDLAGSLSQGVAAGYIASYSRDQELQADQLGAEYLERIKYDPKNMVDVIRVLKSQEQFAADTARAEGREAPARGGWLASHPSNEQRLQEITRIAGQYKGKYEDEGHDRYLKMIDGMTFGESREQGVTRGRQFYHEPMGLALTAPEGWRIQNSPEAVAVVNAAGDAALLLQVAPTKAGNTHENIIRKVFKPEQGRTEKRSLGGFAATHFVGTSRTRQGQVRRIEVTVVTGPGNRNFMLVPSARDARTLQRNREGLQAAEASFRALSSSDMAAARPWTLQTKPYPRGGFAEMAKRSPLSGNAERELRLINGFYAGGEPPPGRLVKVVE